ncbi:MAG: hypothetical protein JNJ85_15590, partial [Candidatus Kapabacteria bacterium]|nr:hypothetical protein [Candidatus Kapabacteria bacterium]
MKTFILLLCVLVNISTVFGQSPIKKIYYGAYGGGRVYLTNNKELHYISLNGSYYRTTIGNIQTFHRKEKILGGNYTFLPNGKFALSIVNKDNIDIPVLYDIANNKTTILPDTVLTNAVQVRFVGINNSSLFIMTTSYKLGNRKVPLYKFYDAETLTLKRSLLDSQNYAKDDTPYWDSYYNITNISYSKDYRYLMIYRTDYTKRYQSIITIYDVESNKSTTRKVPKNFNGIPPVSSSIQDTSH